MDISSLLSKFVDNDTLESIGKSTKTSAKDVSEVLKNAAPSVMKNLGGDKDVAKAVKKLLSSDEVEKIAKKVGVSGDSVKGILEKATPKLKEVLGKVDMSDMLGGIAGKLFNK